jgi:uncharacterized membrane protein HdeD (DUF308 family)
MSEVVSINEASSAMRGALRETVKKHSFLFLLQAALMIVAGILAFAYPLLSSVALAVFLGWMLIFSGVAQILSLIGASQVPHFWLQLISAALAVLIGFLFVRNPGAGIGTLALLMIVFFMVEGMSKIVFSLTVRPLPNWGWVLASGGLGVLIALYLLSNPQLSVVMIGLFIGVQLICEGAAIGWMAWHARKT